MATLAAAMIVKNEEHVLPRCLESLRGKVNGIVVVDTGSTDATMKQFDRAYEFAPVHKYERPWVNFGHNRTELIELAKQEAYDYLLLIDADMTIRGEVGRLDAHGYEVLVEHGNIRYRKPHIVSTRHNWRYVGVTHEYLTGDLPIAESHFGLIITEHSDSWRNKSGRKYAEDVKLLEEQITKTPLCSRTIFYLARSYDDWSQCDEGDTHQRHGRRQIALNLYKRRSQMGGFQEEVFYSHLRAGILKEDLGELLKARALEPRRWEPIHAACQILNRSRCYDVSYWLSSEALLSGHRGHGLFFDTAVHLYLLRFEHAISAFWLGNHREAQKTNELVLRFRLPPNFREATQRNLDFCREAIGNIPAISC
jgi:glycosyltransferase involved in cell wall biosynthesis